MIALPKPLLPTLLHKGTSFTRPNRLLSEKKPMSVAVACQCSDAIVLCADTLFTSPGNSKYHGCKLWYESGENWAVYFAYSGFPQFMDAFRERFPEVLARDRSELEVQGRDSAVTVPFLRDAIGTALAHLHADWRHRRASGAELLCAISVGMDRPFLYRTYGALVSPVTKPYSILGETSLGKFLVPLLIQDWPGWDVGHAAIAAAYIVKAFAEFVDGCGIELDVSHMWVIKPGRTFVQMGDSTMLKINQRLAELHYLAIQVVSSFASSPTQVSPDAFKGLLAALTSRLTEEHHELGQMIRIGVRTRP